MVSNFANVITVHNKRDKRETSSIISVQILLRITELCALDQKQNIVKDTTVGEKEIQLILKFTPLKK